MRVRAIGAHSCGPLRLPSSVAISVALPSVLGHRQLLPRQPAEASAVRMANSLLRAAKCASSRLLRFIHAINRISPSAHHSTISDRRSCQLTCSRNPLIYVFASRPGLLRQHPENELLLVFVKCNRGHALCISACGAGLSTWGSFIATPGCQELQFPWFASTSMMFWP